MILSGELIKEVRRRKGWQQAYLQKKAGGDSNILVTLSRVEGMNQQPNQHTTEYFLSLLDMPVEQFFAPYLSNQNPEQCAQLLSYLDLAEEDNSALQVASSLFFPIKRPESTWMGVLDKGVR